MIYEHLDSVAPVIGTMGSILWAQNGRYAKYTALFWLLSAVAWLIFAIHAKNVSLAACQVFNVCLVLYGCRNWLKATTTHLLNCRADSFEIRVLNQLALFVPRITYRSFMPQWRRKRH